MPGAAANSPWHIAAALPPASFLPHKCSPIDASRTVFSSTSLFFLFLLHMTAHLESLQASHAPVLINVCGSHCLPANECPACAYTIVPCRTHPCRPPCVSASAAPCLPTPHPPPPRDTGAAPLDARASHTYPHLLSSLLCLTSSLLPILCTCIPASLFERCQRCIPSWKRTLLLATALPDLPLCHRFNPPILSRPTHH